MSVNFVTFADSRYLPTLERIKNEAERLNFFDNIYIYTDKDFDKDYKALFERQKRASMIGYGFWCWKSYVVNKALEQVKDNDIVLYCDAGCSFNKAGLQRLQEYVVMLRNDKDILVFDQIFKESEYTKEDLFVFLNVDKENKEIRNTTQYFAGAMIVHKTVTSMELISSWYGISNKHFNLITDKPSIARNSKDFIEHRYDQSVFSILVKRYNNKVVISGNEIIPLGADWSSMKKYPIWANRKKKYTFKDNIKTIPLRIRIRICKMFCINNNFNFKK